MLEQAPDDHDCAPRGDDDSQSVTHRVENHLWVYFGVIFFPCGVQSGGDGSRKGSVFGF